MRKNNYHEFVIKGLNQERFFNKLVKKFNIFDINRYEKNKTSFKVDIKDGKKVRKEILSSNFEILGERKKGFLTKLFDIKNYIGIVSAVVCCLIFYFAQFSLVWQVQVSGVDHKMQNEISNYISQNYDLSKGMDCKDIEIKLQEKFENLSFTSVAVIGQTLVVNAKEGVQPIEKTGEFEPIKAPCDCRITKVKLIQGTLCISEGDSIKQGSVIVQPYIVDSYGQIRKVEAKADITYETWIEGEESHSEEEFVNVRTGKKYVKNELFLFGLKIYSHNDETKFKEFEIETNQKQFTKNNILPFIYKKTTYYETIKVLVEKTYEEVRNQKIESAKQKALQNVEENDKIIDEQIIESKLNEIYFIKYRLTVEKELK